jgi:hypothetical protein
MVMTEQAMRGTAGAGRTREGFGPRTAWVGLVYFGGTMMILAGSFNLVEGLVALFNDEYYLPTAEGLLVLDLTGWGWLNLIMGTLEIIVGIAVFTGTMWARICGVIICVLNAIAQLAFVSAYPVWAVIVIALDVLVIWALIVHGGEVGRPSSNW